MTKNVSKPFSTTRVKTVFVCLGLLLGNLHRGAQTPAAGTASVTALCDILDGELASIKQAGTWKSERVITSKQGPKINVEGRQDEILNFCANNYLGLSVSRC